MKAFYQRSKRLLSGLLLILGLVACSGEHPWNSPYPIADRTANVLYTSFEERPKHLDPVRSYSSNEYAFIANIYEPPLQYHFLKRPYTLVPLTASEMPTTKYYSKSGKFLSKWAAASAVASSVYRINIQKGIRYQPHPALAMAENGAHHYHALQEDELEDIYRLQDFAETGTRELQAADYVYQIKRLAHPRAHSPILGVMSEYIEGLHEYAEKLKEADKPDQWLDLREHDLPGVKIIDDYTYEVRIKGKYPQFKYWLAMPFFAPMPWEADRFHSQPGMKEKNLTLDWYPIGTGPYMLTENNPNLRMTLERNPNFHGEKYPQEGMPGDEEAGLLVDAGKTMPFIDKVINSLEKESIPRWNKFLQGYYDLSGISSDTFDKAISVNSGGELGLSDEMSELGIKLNTAVAASVYYFGFNMLDPVVGHSAGKQGRYLRQAIAIAVDYEEYISIFMNGRGIVAQGPLPPGIYGYTEGEKGVNPVTHKWEKDRIVRRPLEDAKALLKKAGYPDGRSAKTGEVLKLYYDTVASGPDSKAQLNWWRKQFDKLGIELIVRPTDYNRFQDKMRKGTAQLYSWGWNADYPDPENFLFLLYGPNSKVEHHGENASNYSNPKFDKLFEQMKNMENSSKRESIIRQAVKQLREDTPWLWGINPKSYSLYHDWYTNALPNLMANNTLKYKRIDAERRAEKRSEWNQPITWPIWLILVIFVLSALPAIRSYQRRQRATPKLEQVAE